MKRILLATSSFGVESNEPLKLLESAGITYTFNPYKRKLNIDETVSLLQGMDGVIAGTEAYNKEVIEQIPTLKIISRCGAGIDGIDLELLKLKGIALRNTPTVHRIAVAELALTGLLSLIRNIPLNHATIASGKWVKTMGQNLSGKTIAILGLGKVGQAFAQLISGFDCQILGYDPYFSGDLPGIQRVKEVQDVWQQADVISLHMPATAETIGLINKHVLEQVKSTVLVVNTSRGELIHEEALHTFLSSHPLAGAYLDVFQQEPYSGPLTTLPNVILTPHIGTFTMETRVTMEMESVNNLITFFQQT
jgi:D-3-phosphoglycerate dehydrogenase / 2-oxoglutarate reductase